LKLREIKSGNAYPAEFMITVIGVGFIQPVFLRACPHENGESQSYGFILNIGSVCNTPLLFFHFWFLL